MPDNTLPDGPGAPSSSADDASAPARVRRVLLIDDDPDILEVTLLALRAEGFVAESCRDSSQAVASAIAFRPDLILLDAMMPVMDGVGVLRRLRGEPETAAIPVVFVTARVDADAVREYLQLGALAVIGKPFDPLAISSRLVAIATRLG